MTKTLYENYKDFADFYKVLKPRFVADFRPKDKINNLFFSRGVYETYKHETYYGDSDTAINKVITQITFDAAEFSKKEAIHAKIYDKVEKLLNYTTRTENRKQVESQQKTTPPKTITTQNEPLISLTDLSQGAFGGHNRTDWLKTTQKTQGGDTITNISKEGMKVVDKEGKVKIIPNWVEVETQDNAGLSRILAAFQYIEVDLSKYLARYKKFFYRSYGLGGIVYVDPITKRHVFKSYEEIEEELETEDKKKSKIITEEAEISYREWSKKFKAENPDKKPTFQLYTLWRLQKNKDKLEKELKKTGGVFRDKINLRLTGNEDLIAAFEKKITMPQAGKPSDKVSLEASEEELDQASFWAKANRVVGFEDFKKMMASFVRGYNRLTEKQIDKPSQMYLLLGPPGVGKTFIAEMLAEAMNLPSEIISMNGKKDPSMFFGVPQEWAGAGFGEILKSMMKHKNRAIFIILDEFEKSDKLVQKVLGNLTDETVNKKFKDIFLDLAIPINEIIFICTANYPEDIEGFILSRLTKIYLKPLTFDQRIEVAHDLISANFAKYEINHLKDKFNLALIKKCLCREWGVRKLKANIQRLAYEAFLLEGEEILPNDWISYDWPITDYEEIDAGDPARNRPACPYYLDRKAQHRKGCECFKPEMVEGWIENMGNTPNPEL